MRYAISFTPPAGDPLTLAAAQWLGRNAFSGHPVEPPALRGLTLPEIAYYTALPRRYGFHAGLKAPFRLSEKMSEAMLLRHLMRFAGTIEPFSIERMEVARLGDFYGLAPSCPSDRLGFLAAAVVQEFDAFRAPLTEAEIERRDPHGLSAAQLANLHRWGCPHVMDEFRFYMSLTGPVAPAAMALLGPALEGFFAPVLQSPVEVANLALFVEEEPGAPFRVHSLHPLGRISRRRTA